MLSPRGFFAEVKGFLEKKDADVHGCIDFVKKFFNGRKLVGARADSFASPKDFLLYKGRNEETLFHLACKHDKSGRLFHVLLTHFGCDLPSELVLDLQNKFGKKSRAHKTIKEIVGALKTSQDPLKRGVVGLVGLMGALSSPEKIKVGILRDGQDLVSPDTRLSRVLISPLSKKASTPGGSPLCPVWTIQILQPSYLGRSELSIFTEPPSVPMSRDLPLLDLVTHRMPDLPKTLPENTKRPFSFVINQALMTSWKKRDHSKRRYRGQLETMGGHSACDIARLLQFKDVKKRSFHWCHIAAYSMGGPDGQKPLSKDDYNSVGPQQPCNLVFGTKEANAQMLIIEHIVKKLIKERKIKERKFQSLTITVEAFLYPGCEAFHIGNFVEYTIVEPKGFGIFLKLDMLSRRKMRSAEIKQMIEAITNLFIHQEAEPFARDSTAECAPRCLSFVDDPESDEAIENKTHERCDPLSFSQGHKRSYDSMDSTASSMPSRAKKRAKA